MTDTDIKVSYFHDLPCLLAFITQSPCWLTELIAYDHLLQSLKRTKNRTEMGSVITKPAHLMEKERTVPVLDKHNFLTTVKET
jgi:hypothetical protein